MNGNIAIQLIPVMWSCMSMSRNKDCYLWWSTDSNLLIYFPVVTTCSWFYLTNHMHLILSNLNFQISFTSTGDVLHCYSLSEIS
jgi:hypothetical protein